MGKKNDKSEELFDTLRTMGLRKKVARTVSASGARVNNEQSRLVQKTAQSLRTAAATLEDHARVNGVRSTASKSPRSRGTGAKKAATASKSARSRGTGAKRAARSGTSKTSKRGTRAPSRSRGRVRT
jgi:hypothetical protein